MFTDEYFMKEALREAAKALEADEIPVGAVIVCRNRIIGRGHNLTVTLNDPTAHAEMQAFTAATNSLGSRYLDECTLYVTLEPCVMCAGASFWTQIGRVVYGADDPKRGYTLLKDTILHPSTVVTSGIMRKECGSLLKEFFRKKR
jgi:tRNA(adenine34) deaminase